jgi:hypothetical protein
VAIEETFPRFLGVCASNVWACDTGIPITGCVSCGRDLPYIFLMSVGGIVVYGFVICSSRDAECD